MWHMCHVDAHVSHEPQRASLRNTREQSESNISEAFFAAALHSPSATAREDSPHLSGSNCRPSRPLDQDARRRGRAPLDDVTELLVGTG